MELLGRVNYVAEASGVHINLENASGVQFYCYEDDGSQVVTLKESIDGASEQNLAVIDTVYKGPGVGGTWTKVTQTAAATFDLDDDGTNDCLSFYVHASELSDGYNCLELTTDEGSGLGVRAIVDLVDQRAPANLQTSIA